MIYGAWFDFIMKIVFMKKEVLEVVNLRPESSSVRLRLRSLCFTERLESQPPPPHGQRGPASRTAASIVLGGRGDGRALADHSSSSQLGGAQRCPGAEGETQALPWAPAVSAAAFGASEELNLSPAGRPDSTVPGGGDQAPARQVGVTWGRHSRDPEVTVLPRTS